MHVLAISVDPPAESAKFARAYDLPFPLLADVGGAVAKQYVGLNYDDTAIPGIVIVRRDGTIAFRQIGESKYDRLTAAQLFAVVDRVLARHGDDAASGFVPLERWQLRVDAGGGARRVRASDVGAGTHAIAALGVGLFVPLARTLMAGAELRTDGDRTLDVDVAAVVRVPLIHDVGALHATAFAGYAPAGDARWTAGLRVGPWVALTPRWALGLDVGGVLRGHGDREITATLGIAALLGD